LFPGRNNLPVPLGYPDKNPPLFQWGDELKIQLYVAIHEPNIIDDRLYLCRWLWLSKSFIPNGISKILA